MAGSMETTWYIRPVQWKHSIFTIMFLLQTGTGQSEATLSLRAKNSLMISYQCYSLELLTMNGGLGTEQSTDL